MTDETDAPEKPATPRRLGKRGRGPGFITQAAHDTLNVSRAFGPAYEHDGVRVIPVARVMGGTGSGYGGGSLAAGPGRSASRDGADQHTDGADGADDAAGHHRRGVDASGNGDGYGGGGGFGAQVKPLGFVVITDSGARWQPTIDVNRAILGGQAVLALAVLTTGYVLRARHTTVHRLGLPSFTGLLRHRHIH